MTSWLLFAFAASLPASAQDDAQDDASPDRRVRIQERQLERLEGIYQQRTLRNHAFIPPQAFPSPLVTTRLGSVLGVGIASVPPASEDDSSGTYLAAAAGVDAVVKVHDLLSLRGGLDGMAGLGSSGSELLDAGAGASWDWTLGATVGLLRKADGATALGLTPEVRRRASSALVLGPAFDLLVEQAEAADVDLDEVGETLVVQRSAVDAGASLGLAHSFGQAAGLQTELEAGWREQTLGWYDGAALEDDSDAVVVGGGAALTLDASPAPVAVMLEYRLRNVMWRGAGSTQEHIVGGGLFVNGLTNAIGLRVDAELLPDQTSVIRARLGFQAWL